MKLDAGPSYAPEDEDQDGATDSEQWEQLVEQWRRSGRSAAQFARELGVLEGTLRWWAWRLQSEDKTGSNRPRVSLLPVRIVKGPEPETLGDKSTAVPAWTLRTGRGELDVYAPDCDVSAVVAALLGESR